MDNTVFFILAFYGVILVSLSYYVFKIYQFFKKISDNVGKENLTKVLDKILDFQKNNSSEISNIKELLHHLRTAETSHIQRIGFVKFNPFADMGGDHSFSLALLDAKNTGIILTGLHTRDRTRIYIKEVKEGKSKIELSEFEKKAIQMGTKKR